MQRRTFSGPSHRLWTTYGAYTWTSNFRLRYFLTQPSGNNQGLRPWLQSRILLYSYQYHGLTLIVPTALIIGGAKIRLSSGLANRGSECAVTRLRALALTLDVPTPADSPMQSNVDGPVSLALPQYSYCSQQQDDRWPPSIPHSSPSRLNP